VLAPEIVCVLRYTRHAVAATGISSEGVKAEFAQHAKEETDHMNQVAERINQPRRKTRLTRPAGDARGVGLRQRGQLDRDDQENLLPNVSPWITTASFIRFSER